MLNVNNYIWIIYQLFFNPYNKKVFLTIHWISSLLVYPILAFFMFDNAFCINLLFLTLPYNASLCKDGGWIYLDT